MQAIGASTETERLVSLVRKWIAENAGKSSQGTVTATATNEGMRELRRHVLSHSEFKGLQIDCRGSRLPGVFTINLTLDGSYGGIASVSPAGTSQRQTAQETRVHVPATSSRRLSSTMCLRDEHVWKAQASAAKKARTVTTQPSNIVCVEPGWRSSRRSEVPSATGDALPLLRDKAHQLRHCGEEGSGTSHSSSSTSSTAFGESVCSDVDRLDDRLEVERQFSDFALKMATNQDEWGLNGGITMEVEGADNATMTAVTPEELATQNSLRTHQAEEARREFEASLVEDLRHVDRDSLRRFTDGVSLIELVRKHDSQE